MNEHRYPGGELELFAQATRWKAYVARVLRRHLRGDVLEVGAGLGATTAALCDRSQETWVCLEPDPDLARRLAERIAGGDLPACCRAVQGSVADLPPDARFDAIAYIDVLEHIESDGEELARVVRHLRPGGRLIVLAPAHPCLYSPFDAAIGHFRRYTRRSLARVVPAGLAEVTLRYLDSAGLVASAGNRLVLRRALPARADIAVWDRLLVPLSRVVDPLLGFRVGRSLVGVWRAADA